MKDNEHRPYKRKVVYIHRTFQRNFILKFCLIAAIALVIASLLLYFISRDSVTATYHYHHLAVKSTAEAIIPGLIITNALVLVGLIIATVFVTLYISHKIAGPLYRLNKSLDSIGMGDLSMHIKLRQNDQLEEFASTINRMVVNLRKRVKEIESMIQELKSKTEQSTYNHNSIREDIERIEHRLQELFTTAEKE